MQALDPLQAAINLAAHQSASQITFDGQTFIYRPEDHARVSNHTAGTITLQANTFTTTPITTVTLQEAYDTAAEALAAV
jgi:hypothetical protein